MYVCRFCTKKFPTLTNQKRHERIHEGKRFKCDHCQRSFSQTGDLKKHIRKLHPQHFNECAFCGKYFCKRMDLDAHVEGHGENSMTNRRELNRRQETAKVGDLWHVETNVITYRLIFCVAALFFSIQAIVVPPY